MRGKTKGYILGISFASILFLCFFIPVALVWQGEKGAEVAAKTASSEKPLNVARNVSMPTAKKAVESTVAVYRVSQEKVEKVALDQYLFGVLAGEMPASFEMEALKAQAVAARTYIARIVSSKADDNKLPKNADVTDTVMHQVYHGVAELKKQWGASYADNTARIQRAIAETDDLVLTYDSQPIHALFFSTSNGYTENSGEYWRDDFPYLKSVASPWDKSTPKFAQEKTISLGDFRKKLGIAIQPNHKLMANIKRTTGKAIASVRIGGKSFTGREVREKLGLASSDFTMKWKNGKILIATKGYGHQVGMSQYGANGMAKEGKNFREILTHYYTGVTLEDGLSFFVDRKI